MSHLALGAAAMLPAPPNYSDPRLRTGAYISCSGDLYEVTGAVKTSGATGTTTWRIKVENCRNLAALQFLPEKILTSFELVRAAPGGEVPDVVDQITWEAA